jgi:hypothetical protein
MLLALGLALAAGPAGCHKSEWSGMDVDPSQIEIKTDAMTIATGVVGAGKFQHHGTYVLVEATNHAPGDLDVSLGGELLDARGQSLGPLKRESLRMPAGASRVFALVDAEQRDLAAATSASIHITSAVALNYPPPVTVGQGEVYSDQGRAVVSGMVTNTADRPVTCVVIAAFFDARGAPMERKFTVFPLDPKLGRGVQMVGPAGSKSASLYVGDVAY